MEVSRWLGLTLSESQERLLDMLLQCHRNAAIHNQNASSLAVQIAASSGSTLVHSVAAALLVLNDRHGPSPQARQVIYHATNDEIDERLERGEKLPGWGNAFFKMSLDPSWAPMDHLLRLEHRSHWDRLEPITERIFKVRGKILYPNAAAYSAITAEIFNLPMGCETVLIMAARLPAWVDLFRAVEGKAT